MWRYVILNALWFSILFLVHFYGSRKSRLFMAAFIGGLAAYAASQPAIDPFAWAWYLAYSGCAFWTAAQFKRWSTARMVALEDELELLSGRLAERNQTLAQKIQETDALSAKAAEISRLYDKVKEMSRSLDAFEAFLIFTEALSENFTFGTVKLALFAEDSPNCAMPAEAFRMRNEDLSGRVFDRGFYLKDPALAKTPMTPLDVRICERVFETGKPVFAAGPKSFPGGGPEEPAFEPFVAHPVFVQDRIFAVLIVTGIRTKDAPLLATLTERFVSEIRRVHLYERVQRLAITDGLTGVYVRRHLRERLEGEIERSSRLGLRLSFLMIDIDHFKHFNDDFGHLVGDVVLRQVAETIRRSVREIDLVGRYGGEEFAVLLIESDESQAFLIAERVRRSVAEREFKAYDERLRVTVSVGCSTWAPSMSGADALVDAADAALYQAKRQGRNRVCLASMPEV